MKILFVTDNFPPEVNAAASRVYERALYWVKWGHEVTILTSAPNFPQGKVYKGYENKWYYEENMHGLRAIRVKTVIAPNRGKYWRIIDFLSFMFSSFLFGLFQRKPDVVVATSPQFFTAVSGWGLSFLKRVPFIFEVADLWPDSIRAVGVMDDNWFLRVMEKIELFLYRRAKRVVVLTPSFKENLMHRGIPANKIDVIINGVELSQFYPVPAEEALQAQYGLKEKFVIGYIGTFGMAHSLSNVVNAANCLKEDDRFCFLFVGDGAERRQLIALRDSLGLKNVVFIPPQKKQDIKRYWAMCDVALVHLKNNPVFETVIPSKIFEAMAMHLPILISSPKGQAQQVVESAGAGVWVPAEEPQALADAVKDLFEDKQRQENYRQHCREAVSKHSREAQAKLWDDTFTRLTLKEGV